MGVEPVGQEHMDRPTWVMLRCVGFRPRDQEADDAFFGQLEEASHSQALVLMEAFSHPEICQKNETAGLKQSKFLKYTEENFLVQAIEGRTKKDAILDLISVDKEELFGNLKVRGSLGCSDHEMVEFRILREGKKQKAGSQT